MNAETTSNSKAALNSPVSREVAPNASTSTSIHTWWDNMDHTTSTARRGLRSIIILVCWEVWKKRNATMQESSSTRNPRQRGFFRKSRMRRVYGQWQEQNTFLTYFCTLDVSCFWDEGFGVVVSSCTFLYMVVQCLSWLLFLIQQVALLPIPFQAAKAKGYQNAWKGPVGMNICHSSGLR